MRELQQLIWCVIIPMGDARVTYIAGGVGACAVFAPASSLQAGLRPPVEVLIDLHARAGDIRVGWRGLDFLRVCRKQLPVGCPPCWWQLIGCGWVQKRGEVGGPGVRD